MMKTYPIKFAPILKEKVWGGRKLVTKYGKNGLSGRIGESWEISGVSGNISVVDNGVYRGHSLQVLLSHYKEEFLGRGNYKVYGNNFPLLIKFLDANTNLSVQVHPDDEMALKHHNSFGKSEMWYIMDSDPKAEIVMGLRDSSNLAKQMAKVDAKNVESVFNLERVTQGDCYYVPAGKVHALGAGVVAAEIQQTSDITYRIYDWDRLDDKGIGRELHIGMAQKAAKWLPSQGKKNYTTTVNTATNLVSCPFFTTNILDVEGETLRDYSRLDSFVIYMCVSGKAEVSINGFSETLKTGETALLPANSKTTYLKSAQRAKLLEIYVQSEPIHSIFMAS